MKAFLQIALSLIAATSLAGCFEPIQSGGVMIVGDPSERVGALCRFRHKDTGSDSFCAGDAEAPAQPVARVRRMESAAEGLRGRRATGAEGDYLLENDEIAVVVSHPGHPEDALRSGGHVIDAGNVKDGTDALQSMSAVIGSASDHPTYEAIVSGVEGDGSAWVEVSGHGPGVDPGGALLRVRTRYTLAPGARALAIATTVVNAGGTSSPGVALGDAVCWGGAVPDAPGGGLARRGEDTSETRSPYLFGVGEGVGYAIAADGSPFSATHDASCSNLTFTRHRVIAPLEEVRYERLFVVAPRGDTAAIANELFFLSGGSKGGVEIGITWQAAPAERRSESRITLRRLAAPGAATAPFPDPPSLWLTVPAEGALAAELPPGRYAARIEGPGVISPETTAVIEAGKVTRLALVAGIFDGAPQIPQKE